MALTSFSSLNCDKKLHGSEQNPERLWQSNTHFRRWYEQPYSAHPVGGIMISNIIITHNLRHLLYNPKSESSLQDRLPLLVTLENQTPLTLFGKWYPPCAISLVQCSPRSLDPPSLPVSGKPSSLLKACR